MGRLDIINFYVGVNEGKPKFYTIQYKIFISVVLEALLPRIYIS